MRPMNLYGPQDAFPGFFKRVLLLKEGREQKLRMHERTAYVLFMIRAFQVGSFAYPGS